MTLLIELFSKTFLQVWHTLSVNWIFLAASAVIAAALKLYVDQDRVAAFLKRNRKAGVLVATLTSVSTPLCSCGTTAVILGMMAGNMPWAPIVAFMVASPLTSPQEFNLAETVKTAIELGVAALLVENGEPECFHKTVYTGNGQIPVLRVRKSIAQKLADVNGANVELELPLQHASLPCNNVLGFLRGASDDFTLALTAHYDHLGDDSDDVRFPGAFDNASGVASILAAARELVKEKLPFNLLVAFLTGEESGLWGAKQLIAHPPMPISAVINLDGVGSESKLNALRLGHRQRGDWLAELAENILLKRGIEPKWIGGSDDSSAFISKGIPTLGLGQQPTGQARSVMHTPLDTLESLHLETIHEGVEVLVEIVKSISMADPKGLQRPLGSLIEKINQIAFCFLDSEKEMYGEIYEMVIPRLVKGGLLVADNAINHREALQPMLDRAFNDERVDVLIIPIGKGELVCRKV